MEAKELMFNDLVKAKGYSGIIRVDADTMYVIENGNRTPYFNKDDIIPIELSEEILLANGFVEDRYHRWGHKGLYTITGSPISIDMDTYKGIDTCNEEWQYAEVVFNIEFVHELQHALRLCGLTDLADNFKIQ